MDFHALVRKELQFLCKRNGIAANLTNVAMANALQALESVEGIEEIQEALGLQSPKKAESNSSPDRQRTGRASSRRAIHGDESKIKQPSPIPRLSLLTAKALEEGEKKELTKVLPKTPATRKTGKAAETRRSRIMDKNEEDEDPSETPKPVESRNGKAIGVITRRSTRLSSRKPLEEMDTVQSKSRKSIRAKATVEKMGNFCRVEADEVEKEDDKNEPTEKGDSCFDLLETSTYGLLEAVVAQVASESMATEVPKETDNSINLVLNSEIEVSSKDPFAKSSEQIEDQSNAGGIVAGIFIDVPREIKNFQDAARDSLTEFPDESFKNDLQNAAEISSEFLISDSVFEMGVDADPVPLESMAAEISKEIDNSMDLVFDSEIEASSIKTFAKTSEQIKDQCGIVASKFIDVPLETKKFTDVTHDSLSEFPDESFQDDLQNAVEVSLQEDPVFEKGVDADPAEDILLNTGEISTNTSIVASIEFKEAGANLFGEITVVTDKSADEHVIPGTGDLAIPGSVDVASQISSSELQVPFSATKVSETLREMKEEITIQPAVSAALSSSDEHPIEAAHLSVIQTQLLNSEEANMPVEKVEKRAEKENFVQEDNLRSLSLIKLKAMYKQKLASKKEFEGGKSMIIREDVELSGSILPDEQKLENENNEKLERANNSMIRQENLEFCSSIKQMLGDKVKLERTASAIKQSRLDSNWKQKLNEDDKIQTEMKRTPLKNLN